MIMLSSAEKTVAWGEAAFLSDHYMILNQQFKAVHTLTPKQPNYSNALSLSFSMLPYPYADCTEPVECQKPGSPFAVCKQHVFIIF